MEIIHSQKPWHKLAKAYSKDLEASYRKRAHPSITDMRMLLPAVCVWGITCSIIRWPGRLTEILFFISSALACVLLGQMLYAPMKKYWTTIVLSAGLMLTQCFLIIASGQGEAFEAAQSFNNKFVEINGTVRTSERDQNSQKITYQGSQLITKSQGQAFDLPVSFTSYDSAEINVGDGISVRGILQVEGSHYRIKQPTVALKQHGQKSVTNAFKQTMRTYTESTLNSDEAALVLGMTYGDDSGMSDETSQDFRNTGLTHLTAVSGANISLVFVLAFRILQYFRCPRTVTIVISSGVIILYVVLVGAEPSVLRALCMGILGALALISGTGRFSAPMLWTAVIMLLIVEPRYALDFGFALSVVATASLIILAPALVIAFSTVMPRMLSEVLAIPLSASLWCAPIMMLMVQSYQTYSVPANIAATFIVAPVTVLGLLATVCMFLHLQSVAIVELFIQLTLKLAGLCCRALINISHWFSDLPMSVLPIQTTGRSMVIAIASVGLITAITLKLRQYLERTAFYTYRGHDEIAL